MTRFTYVHINGEPVESRVAADFKKLAAAFRARFGLNLLITNGMRTRERQQQLYDDPRYSAAKPGTSLHEEGNPQGPRALDLRDSGSDYGVTRVGNERSNWLRANAPRFGFKPAGFSFRPVIEPWHYEWTGSWGGSSSGGGSTSTGNKYGLSDVRGLQTISAANALPGRATKIDNDWGDLSQEGFDRFLLSKYGDSKDRGLAKWLRNKWSYVGNDVYGPVMKAALVRANNGNFKPVAPPPTPPVVKIPTLPSTNKYGLSEVRGLQKISAANAVQGRATKLDNDWGDLSQEGFDRFLLSKYGNSKDKGLASWLRTRWGYVGNDVYGPVMKAALVRANDANFKAL